MLYILWSMTEEFLPYTVTNFPFYFGLYCVFSFKSAPTDIYIYTVEPPLTDTSRRRMSTSRKRTLSHVPSYITNTAFLTSHKRTPLLSGHFFWSQGYSLTGGLTVILFFISGEKNLYTYSAARFSALLS